MKKVTATDLALSTQVLGEFYVRATGPTRGGALSHDLAARLVGSLRRFPIQPFTYAIVEAAISTGARYRISYWDSAIIEAARAIGCTEVLSEDVGSGTDYGVVLVSNPFPD